MDFDSELAAIQWALRTDCTRVVYVTRKQVRGLVSLMRQGLKNPDHDTRVAVLDLLVGEFTHTITGEPVVSTKSLTSPIASYLINQLKEPNSHPWKLNEHGRSLLAEAEARI